MPKIVLNLYDRERVRERARERKRERELKLEGEPSNHRSA